MLSRRQFLTVSAGGLGALATWRYARSHEENAVVAVLRKRLDYLTLDEQGMRAFAVELVRRKIISGNRLRLVDAAGPVYTSLDTSGLPPALMHPLRHGEERITSIFLLSSDFFVNGADETRVVRYLGYYDPLRQPQRCSNPFSRPLVV